MVCYEHSCLILLPQVRSAERFPVSLVSPSTSARALPELVQALSWRSSLSTDTALEVPDSLHDDGTARASHAAQQLTWLGGFMSRSLSVLRSPGALHPSPPQIVFADGCGSSCPAVASPKMTDHWRAPYRVQTARLNLCALGPEHLAEAQAVVPRNKGHLAPSMPWAQHEPMSDEDRLELLTKMRANFDLGLDFVYGIFDAASARYIGGTGLHARIGPHALEIGYWLDAQKQGNGFVSEAVTALVSVGFEGMGARRLEIRCAPHNTKSRAVPERLEFHLDEVLREGGLSGTGELEDRMVFSVLASEYANHSLFQAPRPRLFDVLDREIQPRWT